MIQRSIQDFIETGVESDERAISAEWPMTLGV